MNCPLFIDFIRTCIEKCGFIPQDTMEYCISERFQECPVYKEINAKGKDGTRDLH